MCYVVLGSIGLMFNLAHSTLGGMLFVASAALAVPHLGCEVRARRAGAWLRTFLVLAVLVPIYLLAGVSKLRYMG